MDALLAVNIGNSRVGLGLFDLARSRAPLPRPDSATSVPVGDPDEFSPDFETDAEPTACVLASVNPRVEAAVVGWTRARFGVPVRRFPDDVPAPCPSAYRPPESAGADRLANAVAAFAEQRRACIVVDAGSAITVDAVADDGTFLGGAILPGPVLAARALASQTALLPECEPRDEGAPIGASTGEAIRSGILRGAAGAVDRLVADVGAELGGGPPAVLTGGAAPILQRLCRTEWVVRPHLTLSGLALAALRFREH